MIDTVKNLELIVSEASPYARTARMVARELGLVKMVKETRLHPFDNPEHLLQHNPLAKVPCLIVTLDNDDTQAIFDSQVIGEFLNDYAGRTIQGAPNLFQSLEQDWHLKTLYSLTRGLLDTAVAWQQDKMRDEGQSEFWQERFISALDRGLAFLEQSLDNIPTDCNALMINSLALLDYLNFRHPEYPWRTQFLPLAEYYETHSTIGSMLETATSQ